VASPGVVPGAGRAGRSGHAGGATVSAPNDSWLPTSDDPLFILAMDQRASFAKEVFGLAGSPSSADVTRMREAKAVIYEGLRHVAGCLPFGREGVLVDEQLGADVARTAKADGLVLLMPIERSGSRVFELEYGDHFVEHVEAFDPDFFKVLVTYNPSDDEEMRRTQITRLAPVSEWADRSGRRWVLELLVPPTLDQLAAHQDQAGFDRDARPALTAQVVSQLQGGGVHPTIWKLEGFETSEGADRVIAAVDADPHHPAVCIVLGRNAPLGRVEHWLEVAAGRRQFAGFAVGRTIWEETLRHLLAGSASRDQVIDAVADTYGTLVDTYTRAHSSD
jgi:myo-inositol catabolism protein IolC